MMRYVNTDDIKEVFIETAEPQSDVDSDQFSDFFQGLFGGSERRSTSDPSSKIEPRIIEGSFDVKIKMRDGEMYCLLSQVSKEQGGEFMKNFCASIWE